MKNERKKPVFIIESPCAQFVERLKIALIDKGFLVLQSFDLQSTRIIHDDCSCPHHGANQCNCEVIVLLIYQGRSAPIPILLDGRDGKTFVSIVIEMEDPSFSHLAEIIEQII